jgi:hypothetical protein
VRIRNDLLVLQNLKTDTIKAIELIFITSVITDWLPMCIPEPMFCQIISNKEVATKGIDSE